MGLADSYAEVVTGYSRVVIALLLVSTLVVGSAAGDVESGISLASFGSDSPEAETLDYVRANFSTEGANATLLQVVVRGDNVLSKEVLLETLRYQRALRENATVNGTLVDGRASVSVANLVATAAVQRERAEAGEQPRGGPPGLDAQIAQLESMSDAEVEATVAAVLDPDREQPGDADPYALLPRDYEAGSTQASGTVVLVRQAVDPGSDELADDVVAGQVVARDLADREFAAAETFAFGQGIVETEALQATAESGPLITLGMLLVVLSVLGYAYRDLLDVVTALVGIALVLVWLFGFMGWVGLGVTQIIIAVPFLLVGLSIDYGLHVVMRYREAREDLADDGGDHVDDGEDPADGDHRSGVVRPMRRGLAGVVVALAATTFTTAVGFLANLVSPIEAIREFALASAAGIVSTFLVFALLVPALKVELETLRARVGLASDRSAFGRAGAANRVLQVGTVAARRAPVAVVLVGLVVAGGGAYAATDVDTSIDPVDSLPEDPPEWKKGLPGPLAASDYRVREDAATLNDEFVRSSDRSRVEILVEGPVTAPDTLQRLAALRAAAADSDVTVTLANGEPAVDGPLELVERTAAANESVAAVVDRNDADGDGIPDRNLAAVYDAVYAADPAGARRVVHRADGEYRALRVTVTVDGSADTATVTREMRTVAAAFDSGDAGDDPLVATATGDPIVDEVVQAGLLRTLVEGFAITLAVIATFLAAIFHRRYRAPELGLLTLVPVLFALAWILGTMYLLDIPFSTETAVITSIAIGLGVDYAIHTSERYLEERARADDPAAALERTVAGTGGALLASAATTAGGFGVLLLALVPQLQRFGLVTGVTIVYAFLASVVVLPCLLVLWERVGGRAAVADPAATGD